jgi:hypothetical protein
MCVSILSVKCDYLLWCTYLIWENGLENEIEQN